MHGANPKLLTTSPVLEEEPNPLSSPLTGDEDGTVINASLIPSSISFISEADGMSTSP